MLQQAGAKESGEGELSEGGEWMGRERVRGRGWTTKVCVPAAIQCTILQLSCYPAMLPTWNHWSLEKARSSDLMGGWCLDIPLDARCQPCNTGMLVNWRAWHQSGSGGGHYSAFTGW